MEFTFYQRKLEPQAECVVRRSLFEGCLNRLKYFMKPFVQSGIVLIDAIIPRRLLRGFVLTWNATMPNRLPIILILIENRCSTSSGNHNGTTFRFEKSL